MAATIVWVVVLLEATVIPHVLYPVLALAIPLGRQSVRLRDRLLFRPLAVNVIEPYTRLSARAGAKRSV
jgi:hypothetical protein